MDKESYRYVIITPAKNEQAHIARLADSVIAQTQLPERWIIINDGSTDMTEEIVRRYMGCYPFISLINREGENARAFSSKAAAVNFAYSHLCDCQFHFIGNLDADVSFGPDYFERLIGKFHSISSLGIAGGVCYDCDDGEIRRMKLNLNSVRGAVQLFRRECFAQIGGYKALRFGGIDSLAEFTALMNGWKVRSFEDLVVLHHRWTGTGAGNLLRACFKRGKQDFSLGYNALFEIARLLNRVTDSPMFVGSVTTLFGYVYAMVNGYEIEAPADVVEYIRQEQLRKIFSTKKDDRHVRSSPDS